MRIVPCFVAGVAWVGASCGHPPNNDFFAPTTTDPRGSTTSGAGDPSTGSTTSGSDSATSSGATGGGAGTDPSGAVGASATVGAGGAGGDPTTGPGGSDPGMGGSAGGDEGGVAGGPPDAGSADAGGSGSVRRIRCGDVMCSALDQFCCLRDGRIPRCEPLVGGDCPTSGDRLYCDDRSDCLANQICCAADLPSTNSLADCRLPGTCNGTKAQRLCDPQDASSCAGFGMNGACTADGQSTIDGYAYCH